MIHNQDGSTKPIPYGKENQCIYSVGRRYVNEILLDEGSKHDNITFHFNHKLLRANLETAELVFEHQEQDHKFSFLIETFTTFEEKKQEEILKSLVGRDEVDSDRQIRLSYWLRRSLFCCEEGDDEEGEVQLQPDLHPSRLHGAVHPTDR